MAKDEFERHHATIHHYYIKEKMILDEVMQIMESKHNFKRSKRCYQNQFKEWGYKKNIRGTDMELFLDQIHKGVPEDQVTGIDPEVLLAIRNDKRKVRRYIQRKRNQGSKPGTPDEFLYEPEYSHSASELMDRYASELDPYPVIPTSAGLPPLHRGSGSFNGVYDSFHSMQVPQTPAYFDALQGSSPGYSGSSVSSMSPYPAHMASPAFTSDHGTDLSSSHSSVGMYPPLGDSTGSYLNTVPSSWPLSPQMSHFSSSQSSPHFQDRRISQNYQVQFTDYSQPSAASWPYPEY